MATTATPWTPTAAATAAGGPAVVVEMQQELMTHGPLEAGIELFQASTSKERDHFPAQPSIFRPKSTYQNR